MNQKKIPILKKNYVFKELKENAISNDPFIQFNKWFSDAVCEGAKEVNAMYLATSSKKGRPSVRTVLLKAYDKNGFIFFTNYESKKGSDLKENPYAALLFFWKETERQVRIEGKVRKVTKKESDEYFHSRPYDSQIAAWASNQSSVLRNREVLEKKFSELKEKYNGKKIPLPYYWGGYRLIPDMMEFWQGRQNRLHDRILFTKEKSSWNIERLAP